MTAAEVLEIAARQAESQPGVSRALSEALGFLDGYPPVLRVLDSAARAPRLSLALSLALRCHAGRDVAAVIRGAAFPGGAVVIITPDRACDGKRKMSRDRAKRVLAWYRRHGAAHGSMNAYPCPFDTSHWHVGHIPGQGKRKVRS